MKTQFKPQLLLMALLLLVTTNALNAQTKTFKNPIQPGFYPDPSICRVGTDYYMVHSTFEYYPGVPIFHSTDLVNWQQIGNVLNRPSQLNLPDSLKASQGIFAPNIHYHDSLFYMITTCVYCNNNFFVTATNPAGPWSDPIWVTDAPGIDPSLFWDDDGKSYYVGGGNLNGTREWEGQNGAFISEIDLKTGKLVGSKHQMTFGHATNAVWGEGPHLYKINGRYMLMIAEGGTSIHHAITVFESKTIFGKYEPSLINPVLTHRHLGKNYPITSVGHCSIVETQNGEWWGVLLGIRELEGKNMLGRETFLIPLIFEDGWPVFNPGIGVVREHERLPDLPQSVKPDTKTRCNFDQPQLPLNWNMLRTPQSNWYKIENSMLVMQTRPQKTTQNTNPSALMRRIQHFTFESYANINFKTTKDTEEAGFIALYSDKNQYRLALSNKKVKLICVKNGIEKIVDEQSYKGNEVVFGLKANKMDYQFVYGSNKDNMMPIGPLQDASMVSTSNEWGFTGPFVGVYTTSNGLKSKNSVSVDWFDYIAGDN